MTTPSDSHAGDGEPDAAAAPDRLPLTGCHFVASVAAELALGSLAGAERSAALAQLETCEGCRALVEELALTADALLLAAPEGDPPAGFEVRWLERLHASAPAQHDVPSDRAGEMMAPGEQAGPRTATILPFRRRGRALLAAAAAAVVLAGGGVAVGHAVTPNDNYPAAGRLRQAPLRAPGAAETAAATGEVTVIPGKPAWVVMTFSRAHWSGWVECAVVLHGHTADLGHFWVAGGSGSWSAKVPVSDADFTSARVLSASGTVLASATFST